VNITNDEWFGRTGALYQHAAMALPGVEDRLPWPARHTGLTFFVDVRGASTSARGVFTREVALRASDRPGPSPVVRLGDWPGRAGCR